MGKGKFAHSVFFWLKNPENKEEKNTFEKSLFSFINQSVYIKSKHIGTPADTNRDVIDSSYTYSLLVTFDNKRDHDSYQEEPNHKKFISECSELWKKVVVYDSENILQE